MRQESVSRAFEAFLRQRSLKLTAQRRRVLERAFATHEHFSAEQLFAWLAQVPGPKVSRATVYRTLSLLQEGAFIAALDVGRGELFYEHVLGHRHHDHMICLDCGKIEEFHDERIENVQRGVCEQRGFELVSHTHRLLGYCRSCGAARKRDGAKGDLAKGDLAKAELAKRNGTQRAPTRRGQKSPR